MTHQILLNLKIAPVGMEEPFVPGQFWYNKVPQEDWAREEGRLQVREENKGSPNLNGLREEVPSPFLWVVLNRDLSLPSWEAWEEESSGLATEGSAPKRMLGGVLFVW